MAAGSQAPAVGGGAAGEGEGSPAERWAGHPDGTVWQRGQEARFVGPRDHPALRVQRETLRPERRGQTQGAQQGWVQIQPSPSCATGAARANPARPAPEGGGPSPLRRGARLRSSPKARPEGGRAGFGPLFRTPGCSWMVDTGTRKSLWVGAVSSGPPNQAFP